MASKHPTVGIILAAGISSRFGTPKQLIKIGKRTLIEIIVDNALNSKLDQVVVVLGHAFDCLMQVLSNRVQHSRLSIIENKEFRKGMSSSIHCALHSVQHDYPSAMFLLGDQPLIRGEMMDLILERFRSSDKDICIPVYQGQRGNPTIFSQRFYHNFFEISGDVGGKQIIQTYPHDICEVEVDDPFVFTDIDKLEDLEKIKTSRFFNAL